MPADDNDWRLQGQEKYLKGTTLTLRPYRRWSPTWTHDHCSFCHVEFMDEPGPEILTEGYCTLDEYHWICPTCFDEFKYRFEWTVAPAPKAGRIELIGVHPVTEAKEACHLIELLARDADLIRLADGITQLWPGRPRSSWQVPYDEHFLTEDGTAHLDVQDPASPPPGNDGRMAFFFHHLDLSRPLITPAGALPPPSPTPRPQRLSFIVYEPPC